MRPEDIRLNQLLEIELQSGERLPSRIEVSLHFHAYSPGGSPSFSGGRGYQAHFSF